MSTELPKNLLDNQPDRLPEAPDLESVAWDRAMAGFNHGNECIPESGTGNEIARDNELGE